MRYFVLKSPHKGRNVRKQVFVCESVCLHIDMAKANFCITNIQQIDITASADNKVGMGKVRRAGPKPRGVLLRSSGVEAASITFYHLISQRRGRPVSGGGKQNY